MDIIEQLLELIDRKVKEFKFWIFKEFVRNDRYYRDLLSAERDEINRQRYIPFDKVAKILTDTPIEKEISNKLLSGLGGLIIKEGPHASSTLLAAWGTEEFDTMIYAMKNSPEQVERSYAKCIIDKSGDITPVYE